MACRATDPPCWPYTVPGVEEDRGCGAKTAFKQGGGGIRSACQRKARTYDSISDGEMSLVLGMSDGEQTLHMLQIDSRIHKNIVSSVVTSCFDRSITSLDASTC